MTAPATPTPPREYSAKEIVLTLAASATLADHLGDMWSDLFRAMALVGLEPPKYADPESDEFKGWLIKNGARTVWDTPIGDEDDYLVHGAPDADAQGDE